MNYLTGFEYLKSVGCFDLVSKTNHNVKYHFYYDELVELLQMDLVKYESMWLMEIAILFNRYMTEHMKISFKSEML